MIPKGDSKWWPWHWLLVLCEVLSHCNNMKLHKKMCGWQLMVCPRQPMRHSNKRTCLWLTFGWFNPNMWDVQANLPDGFIAHNSLGHTKAERAYCIETFCCQIMIVSCEGLLRWEDIVHCTKINNIPWPDRRAEEVAPVPAALLNHKFIIRNFVNGIIWVKQGPAPLQCPSKQPKGPWWCTAVCCVVFIHVLYSIHWFRAKMLLEPIHWIMITLYYQLDQPIYLQIVFFSPAFKPFNQNILL